jgi:hypothetical protein
VQNKEYWQTVNSVKELGKTTTEQSEQLTKLTSALDSIPPKIRAIDDKLSATQLEFRAIQTQQEQRINDLAREGSDICKAISGLPQPSVRVKRRAVQGQPIRLPC